ncbi:MAG: alpha/beta hydrolase [Bacteroidales bacterium]|nr:alpha/beta hydrolase [Bacteroidales bacterium]
MKLFTKNLSGIFLITLFLIGFGTTSFSQEHRSVKLGEIREVHSDITGVDYELIINYPYSYSKDTLKKYPVVYFCDGYYDFPLMTAIYGSQIYDQTIAECFLVGFSYKGDISDYGPLRMFDYVPTKDKFYKVGGGAPDFLKVVEQDFIPYMENNFRIDTNWRALGGSSAGGLFTLYALFTRPNLFDAYMAISPATLWDNNWLFKYEEEFSKTHSDLPVSLYMTGGEKENSMFVSSIKKFDEVLKNRNYTNFRYQFRILDNSYHSGSKPEGYNRGMLFIFEPLLKK